MGEAYNGFPAALATVLFGSFLSRWPFRHAPLIRDEGEYALLGQLIREGAVPYLDIYYQKTPFTFYWMSAVQAMFGESLPALRVTTAIYGIVILVAVYALARRLSGPVAGIAAALAMAVLI